MWQNWEFPGGPVVNTWCSHSWGPGFDPWLGKIRSHKFSSFAQARGTGRMGKCRGLRTARKLRSHQRDQKWHDKQYKKAHLGTALKANPFGGASHTKGIVLEKVGVEAQQPNSAIRKCVRVQLIKNGKKNHCFCTQWWLLEFYWGKWWSSGCWIWFQRSCCWWHSWSPL